MEKTRIHYTRELLNSLLERDKAELIGEYNNINSKTNINFKCNCGNIYQKFLNQIYKYGGLFCKKCTINKTINKKKENSLKKYGVENPFQIKEIKEKIKSTMIEKYGVENALQNKNIYDKRKGTIIEKYGVEHILSSNSVRDKIKKTNIERYGVENPLQNKEIYNKMTQTNIERYGVSNPLQNKESCLKMQNTNLEKYGVSNPLQNKEILEKVKKTNIERYGVENPLQNKEILEKMKKTNIERYGFENPTHNDEIYEKMIKNMRKFKDYIMPSGELRRIQGYEHFALNILLKEYQENNIITRRKNIPKIYYETDNEKHCYYPDIYIPSENKIIEVKSTWTLRFKNNNIKEKAKATIEKGFIYEIWCFNSKGERVQIDEIEKIIK